jgi:hypothetical protein
MLEEYNGLGKTPDNCAYAYWDDDDINDDLTQHISGPFCGCEKEKARYGAYGACACGGTKDCMYWALRRHKDCNKLPATEEEYEKGAARWKAERDKRDEALLEEINEAATRARAQVQADMIAILEGRTARPDDDHEEEDDEAEIERLERRFLEETKAHDKTRYRLECRERELERIRSNMYSQRVDEVFCHAADAVPGPEVEWTTEPPDSVAMGIAKAIDALTDTLYRCSSETVIAARNQRQQLVDALCKLAEPPVTKGEGGKWVSNTCAEPTESPPGAAKGPVTR